MGGARAGEARCVVAKKTKAAKKAKKIPGKRKARRAAVMADSPRGRTPVTVFAVAHEHTVARGNAKRAAGAKTAPGGTAAGPAEAELTINRLRMVAVDAIEDKGAGGRQARPDDDQQVGELASSIDGVGLLQPIGVVEVTDGRYRLVWGWRRLQAFRKLGRRDIPARVYASEAAAMLGQLRAVENVQRRDWNLIEEAVAVADLLDAVGEGVPDGFRIVAERLGKSEGWVKDRAYLARLDGQARELVVAGRLPLAHAREIATLADPTLRTEVARRAARDADGSRGLTLDQVKSWVRQYRHSLKVVPWRLDAPIAGKVACAECPANTANDLQLYSHDAGEARVVAEGGPYCMHKRCFEQKQAAAAKIIDAGVTRVAAAAKKDKELPVTERSLGDKGLIPEAIKPATFVRKARQDVAPAAAAEDKPARLAGGGPGAQPKETAAAKAKRLAEERFEKANDEWRAEVEKHAFTLLAKRPGALVLLTFYMMSVERFVDLMPGWGGDDREKKVAKLCQSPDVRAMLKTIVDGDVAAVRELETRLGGLMAEGKRGDKVVRTDAIDGSMGDDLGRAVFVALAELAGEPFRPAPTLEEFTRDAPAEEPKPAAAKAGKGKAKTAEDDEGGGGEEGDE